MNKIPIVGILLAATATALAVGSRVGGPYDISHESLNSGGISYASNGVIKLGGSIGQAGFVFLRTNATATTDNHDGFWKSESPCEMYPVAVSDVSRTGTSVSIRFNTMLSNEYSVAYLNLEGGGLTNGTHLWTNIVAGPLIGQGGIGSTTSVLVDVSIVTNAGRFFLIRCE